MLTVSTCGQCKGRLEFDTQNAGAVVNCPHCGQPTSLVVAEPSPPGTPGKQGFDEAAILALQRPHSRLMTYYVLRTLLAGPLFPVAIIPQYFRYHTLRYRFDAEGISMRWGILFRREVILNYSRIQDIHLSSNLIERWLGLARVQIQTASGSAAAEMTIEGLREFEAVRDFLYGRMRGTKESGLQRKPALGSAAPGAGAAATLDAATAAELTVALRETAAALRALRSVMAQPDSGKGEADV
jgi:putative membrane protein